jgi:hypothetical protein
VNRVTRPSGVNVQGPHFQLPFLIQATAAGETLNDNGNEVFDRLKEDIRHLSTNTKTHMCEVLVTADITSQCTEVPRVEND